MRTVEPNQNHPELEMKRRVIVDNSLFENRMHSAVNLLTTFALLFAWKQNCVAVVRPSWNFEIVIIPAVIIHIGYRWQCTTLEIRLNAGWINGSQMIEPHNVNLNSAATYDEKTNLWNWISRSRYAARSSWNNIFFFLSFLCLHKCCLFYIWFDSNMAKDVSKIFRNCAR